MAHADHSTDGLPAADEAAISALAQQTATDTAVVKDLYQEELAALQAQSSIKNFIGVIAARRVRQRLTSSPGQERAVRRSRAAAPPKRPPL